MERTKFVAAIPSSPRPKNELKNLLPYMNRAAQWARASSNETGPIYLGK